MIAWTCIGKFLYFGNKALNHFVSDIHSKNIFQNTSFSFIVWSIDSFLKFIFTDKTANHVQFTEFQSTVFSILLFSFGHFCFSWSSTVGVQISKECLTFRNVYHYEQSTANSKVKATWQSLSLTHILELKNPVLLKVLQHLKRSWTQKPCCFLSFEELAPNRLVSFLFLMRKTTK